MKIGILSDTHGHLGRVSAAQERLAAAGAKVLIHCGDIGGSMVLLDLAVHCEPLGIPVHAVLGNVDLFNSDLYPWRQCVGVEVHGEFGRLTLAGKRIAIAHGHDGHRLEQAIVSGDYDYVLTGHTHQARDERCGQTRVINPGALYKTGEPSVAVLDLATDQLTFYPIA